MYPAAIPAAGPKLLIRFVPILHHPFFPCARATELGWDWEPAAEEAAGHLVDHAGGEGEVPHGAHPPARRAVVLVAAGAEGLPDLAPQPARPVEERGERRGRGGGDLFAAVTEAAAAERRRDEDDDDNDEPGRDLQKLRPGYAHWTGFTRSGSSYFGQLQGLALATAASTSTVATPATATTAATAIGRGCKGILKN